MPKNSEFKKDIKKIQTNLQHPDSAREWSLLKSRIQEFMNESRRTWSSAVFYLLEKGLEYERERYAKLTK